MPSATDKAILEHVASMGYCVPIKAAPQRHPTSSDMGNSDEDAATDRHGELELSVFSEFAKASALYKPCPLNINPSTIKKRFDPEPDIRCCSADGARLAFEMVCTDDSDDKRRTSDCPKLEACLKQAWDDDQNNERHPDLKHNLDSVIVIVKDDVSLQRKRSIVPDIITFVNSLNPQTCGVVSLTDKLATVIDKMRIARRDSDDTLAPFFHVNVAGSVGDYTLERVRGKLCASHKYKSNAPIHLLAWATTTCMPITWKGQLTTLLSAELDQSNFCKIWIFHREDKIVYSYPE